MDALLARLDGFLECTDTKMHRTLIVTFEAILEIKDIGFHAKTCQSVYEIGGDRAYNIKLETQTNCARLALLCNDESETILQNFQIPHGPGFEVRVRQTMDAILARRTFELFKMSCSPTIQPDKQITIRSELFPKIDKLLKARCEVMTQECQVAINEDIASTQSS